MLHFHMHTYKIHPSAPTNTHTHTHTLTHGYSPHDPGDETRQNHSWVYFWLVAIDSTVDHEVQGAGQKYATILTEKVVQVYQEKK